MPDYKKMYYILLNETAKAIEGLEKAQQKTKELCSELQNTSESPEPAEGKELRDQPEPPSAE